MQTLREEGVVSAISLGFNKTEICVESLELVDLDLLMIAGRYTLLNPQGAAFFDLCRRRGVGVVAAGVFNSGILATDTGGDGRLYYDYEPAPDVIVRKAAAIEACGARYGVPLPAAASQFVRAHPR